MWAIVGYFVGCFNFAWLISRLKKRDIRNIGSGNPGTMNMTREFGLKIGMLTFFGDAFKGGIPAVIAYLVYRGYVFSGTEVLVCDFMRYFTGLWVVIGHIFPVTLRFKGGKGIASTFGVFWFTLLCESWWWFLIGCLVILGVIAYIYFFKWGAMGSLSGVTVFTIIQMVKFIIAYEGTAVNAYLVCLYLIVLAFNVFVWFAHKENVMRLYIGQERKTLLKGNGSRKSGK